MKKITKYLAYTIIAVCAVSFILLSCALVLVRYDDNEFHNKERTYIQTVGEKIGRYYLETGSLPNTLESIDIGTTFPYPPIKLFELIDVRISSDYKLIYYPVDKENFSLVLTNNQKYVIYYYSDDWELFKKTGHFDYAFFVYNDIPYKSVRFLENKKEPFKNPDAWPEI